MGIRVVELTTDKGVFILSSMNTIQKKNGLLLLEDARFEFRLKSGRQIVVTGKRGGKEISISLGVLEDATVRAV